MSGNKKLTTLAEHLTQLRESTQALQKHLAPLADIQQRMEEFLRPIVEAQERLHESLRPIVEVHQRMAELTERVRIPDTLAADLSRLVQPAIEFRQHLEELISPAFRKLAENFEKLPERTRNTLLILGQHGWFLDLEMPVPGLWEFERALANGNVEEAEQTLVQYYREKLSDIAESLITNYPHRTAIIRAAFNAHHRGEYELSVPVFLAQADGICQELINFQLFTKRDKQPATAAYVKTIAADTLRAALLYPLAHPLPISASVHERDTDFNDLNRHQVLHGESVDYGTETNSLKAISLLNYVAHVLKRDDEDK